MSKIEELINRLCPDGVEFKKLGEIGTICMCKRILKQETTPIGDVPFYKIGTFGKTADSFISSEKFNEYKSKYNYPKVGDVLISAAGTIGRYILYDGSPAYFQDSNIVWLSHNEKIVTNKYLAYFYSTNPWRVSNGGTIPRLYNNDILKTIIPIPPLEIQQEIVRILDNFTELTNELTNELTARKKQYEYYRDKLLTFDKDDDKVKWMKLGDICSKVNKIKWANNNNHYLYVDLSSVDIQTKQIHSEYWINKENAPSRAQQIINKGDVLFATTRPTQMRFCIIDKKYDNQICSTGFCVLRPKIEKVLNKWIYYIISTQHFFDFVSLNQKGTGYPSITDKEIFNFFIPIPSIETQQRIVSILDRFDQLCNDLTAGLPAEIEARRKQYEYYRDKLLTFKEKKA